MDLKKGAIRAVTTVRDIVSREKVRAYQLLQQQAVGLPGTCRLPLSLSAKIANTA